jgi:hypothetical protein
MTKEITDAVVRVTRSYQAEIVQYVDVHVTTNRERTPYLLEKVAKDLVQAQIAAGQDIDWIETSEEPVLYPSPSFEASVLEPENTTQHREGKTHD